MCSNTLFANHRAATRPRYRRIGDSDANGIHGDLGSRVALFSGHGCRPYALHEQGWHWPYSAASMPVIDSISAPSLHDAWWNLRQPPLPSSLISPREADLVCQTELKFSFVPAALTCPLEILSERSQGGVPEGCRRRTQAGQAWRFS